MKEPLAEILILTDGKPGHQHQAEAFAALRGCRYRLVPVRFRGRAAKALSYLFDRFGLYVAGLLSAEVPPGTFRAVVAAGSETYYAARTVARRLGIPVVAVMLPKGYRYDFDLIVAQVHDRPPKRDNIVALPVNICRVEPRGIVTAESGARYVSVILGGDNKVFAMDAEALRRALPRGRSLGGAVLYGAVGFGGSFGFIYPALREVPAGTAIVFLALVPLETFGLAILQRQERFRVQGLLGAVIALVGVVVVVADQLSGSVPALPMVSVLAGTLFIAESAVILKAIPRSDPFATNGVAMLAAGAIFLVLSLGVGEAWQLPTRASTWTAIAYLIVFGSAVMFGLFLFAVRRWTASAVSYVTLLMPLVTVPLAAVLIDESVSAFFLAGSAVAVFGVYVGSFLRVRPRRSSAISLPECLPIDACAEPA